MSDLETQLSNAKAQGIKEGREEVIAELKAKFAESKAQANKDGEIIIWAIFNELEQYCDRLKTKG